MGWIVWFKEYGGEIQGRENRIRSKSFNISPIPKTKIQLFFNAVVRMSILHLCVVGGVAMFWFSHTFI
jgi:hypothetical protein